MKIQDIKLTITYLLDRNLELIEAGQNKLSINIVGKCGIGKTYILKELADERGARYIRIELGSCEEVGDLLGMPIKQFTMLDKDGNEFSVPEKLLDEYIKLGYTICPNCLPKMTYAPPSWVPEDDDQEIFLVLDDFSRKFC